MPESYYRICFFLMWLITSTIPSLASKTPTLPVVLTNPSNCNLNMPINDFSCNTNHEFQILVDNVPNTTLGIDVYLKEVRLIIAHEWVADMDITLISPSGKTVELSSDNGSGNDNYGIPGDCNSFTSFISDNETSSCDVLSITSATAPFLGSYLPEQSLSIFNDGSDPRGIWTLQICDDGEQHYGSLEFLELVFAPSVCLQPTAVEIIAVDSNTITIDWQPGSNCENTIIEWGPPGFMPGSDGVAGGGFVVLDSCPPTIITGLSPSADYELYIREECGTDIHSTNSCVIDFSTTCSPLPATEREDFNSQIQCDEICGISCNISGTWRNSLLDNFDWIVHKGPVNTTGTGPTDDVPGGGNYIYIETSFSLCRNGRNAVLVSNCMRVEAGPDSCDMSFDYLLNGANVNSLSLDITTDGGVTWQQLWSAGDDQGPAWRKKFINLDAYQGQEVQFRFLGKGGNGPRGDIALDNIVFYGTEDLGPPPFVYFQDQDMDGYGGKDVWFATCQPGNFFGFVPDSTDCDDFEEGINPGVMEFPCDLFDVNCNGLVDEFIVAPPNTTDTTVCSGSIGAVFAEAAVLGEIHWYSDSTGGDLLSVGPYYAPPDFPSNFSSDPISLKFYAEEVRNDSCLSSNRAVAMIHILPQPDLSSIDNPEICERTYFDLSTIDVIDVNGANGVISYHQDFPPESSNEIPPFVYPEQNDTFYIVSTPNGGCSDVSVVTFDIKPTPEVNIQGPEYLCFNTKSVLEGTDVGEGLIPLNFTWNTGEISSNINISSNLINGTTDIYTLQIDGANGCFDIDTIAVKTTTSIDSVHQDIQAVSICDGSDGVITLTPFDGSPPYNYFWNNSSLLDQPGGITVNGLMQGSYTFTITDSSPENCELILPLVTVDGPGAIVANSVVTPVSCNGGSDGCIELEVIGNTPVINWSTGATTSSICGLIAGNYTVTITDGDCENVLTYLISQPEKIQVNPAVKNVTCSGGQDGSIFLNIFGGNPPYQYQWSTGQITQGINNLTAGDYAVSIIDTRGCFAEIPVITVEEPNPISYDTVALNEPSCFGFADGEMTIRPMGGAGVFDVDWGNSGMGTTITNLAAGNYAVSIEDVNGCLLVDTINLDQPTPIVIDLDNISFPVCNGINNGEIPISVSGGIGPYTFLWSNDSIQEDLIGLPPGFYEVTVTDANGCTKVSDPINLSAPQSILPVVNKTDPQCVGLNNGSIFVSVSTGGVGPFQYSWSTDEIGPLLENLGPGDYIVTITDNLGCQVDTTINLLENQPIVMGVNKFEPSCSGLDNGQIFLNFSGGMAPYDIVWSDGRTDNPMTNLIAGNYAATITDDLGCKYFTSLISLRQPDPITIDVLNTENVVCHGVSSGSIDLAIEGGIGAYNISWSNGVVQTTANSGLSAGSYSVTIEDENNCVKEETDIEILQPAPLDVTANQLITGCNGGMLDSVCVEVAGGEFPYEFSWNNGNTEACLVNEPVGDYVVTVTDNAGCTLELMSVKVPEEVEVLSLEQLPSVDTICSGANNGEIPVSVVGSGHPYQFIWNNGETGLTSNNLLILQGLTQGNYEVTVTDVNGCTAELENMTIFQGTPINPVAAGTQIENVNCKSGEDGSINLNVTGGFPSYSFLWLSESGDTLSMEEDISNLSAGDYIVEIEDTRSCMATTAVSISEPEENIQLLAVDTIHESCFEAADGSINILPIGGTPGYSYVWNNGAITEDISGLSPGEYWVVITDENNCSYQSTNFMVFGPDEPLRVESADLMMVSCFGGTDGAIEIETQGGTDPYFYDWQVSNNENLIDIGAGEYFLTLRDRNLCQFDTSFVITQPPALELALGMTPANAGANGSAFAVASGGVGPYLFLWDNNGETTDTIVGLAPGYYMVTITDANFCTISDGIEVSEIVSVDGKLTEVKHNLYPNPTNGYCQLNLSFSENHELQLMAFDPLGNLVFNQSAGHFKSGIIDIDLSDQPPGVYIIVGQIEGTRAFATRVLVF